MSIHRLAFHFGATAAAPVESAAARGRPASGAGAGEASFESTLAEQLAEHAGPPREATVQRPPRAKEPAPSGAPPTDDGDARPQRSTAAFAPALPVPSPQRGSSQSGATAQLPSTADRGGAGATQPAAAPTTQPAPPPAGAQRPVAATRQQATAKSDERAAKPEVVAGEGGAPTAVDQAASERALDALALNGKTSTPREEQPVARTAAGPKAGAEKSAQTAGGASGEALAYAQSGSAALAQPAGGASPGSRDQTGRDGAEAASGDSRPAAAARKAEAFAAKDATATAQGGVAPPPPSSGASTPPSFASEAAPLKGGDGAASARALPFAHEASADPSLHVSLLPQAAHLRMDLDGAGALALHLRLRDGVAHVTVAGSAASLVESRAGDLRTALASQGLQLGQVQHVAPAAHAQETEAPGQQLSQDGSPAQEREQPEAGEARKPAPQAAARPSTAFTISRSTSDRAR